MDLWLPPHANFCKNRLRGYTSFVQIYTKNSKFLRVWATSAVSPHFIPMMLKFERTWETLGIPQRHKISSESLNGYCTWPAGIALPRRWCILISLRCFRTVECQQVEFQVDGAATEKARQACSVCMRGTTSSSNSTWNTQATDRWYEIFETVHKRQGQLGRLFSLAIQPVYHRSHRCIMNEVKWTAACSAYLAFDMAPPKPICRRAFVVKI